MSLWIILIVLLIYCTATSTRAAPGSQGHPIVVNDTEAQQMPAGHRHIDAPRVVQNTARNPRPREQPYAHGVQVQEPRPAAAHPRNNYNVYYDNRYYRGQGSQGGYRGNGGLDRDYHHQSNYMQGMPGTYYPGYGQCHLCGKYSRMPILPSHNGFCALRVNHRKNEKMCCFSQILKQGVPFSMGVVRVLATHVSKGN